MAENTKEISPEEVGQYPRPTNVRYEVLALTTLMGVLLYLDRFCISMAILNISIEFKLSALEKSLALSAFTYVYAFSQVPVGWLGERYGARLVLGLSLAFWSLFTGLTGFVWGAASLIAIRVLLGISQAAAFPVTGRVYSRWVPFQMRGIASGIATLGGRAGSAAAPFLTGYLILAFYGEWRYAFWIYAGLGIVLAGYFMLRFRETPQTQPRCNAAEVDLIVSSRPAQTTNPHVQAKRLPWKAIFRSRDLWFQCVSQMGSNVGFVFLAYLLPMYFYEYFGATIIGTGIYATLPLVGAALGCLLGGWATDRMTRWLGLRWGRAGIGAAAKLFAAVWLIAVAFIPKEDWQGPAAVGGGLELLAYQTLFHLGPWLATAALFLTAFAGDLGQAATWAYFQDAGGPYVGALQGWANMLGNLAGAAGTQILVLIAALYGWQATILTCAVIVIISGLCWFGCDATKPIVPEESPAPAA